MKMVGAEVLAGRPDDVKYLRLDTEPRGALDACECVCKG